MKCVPHSATTSNTTSELSVTSDYSITSKGMCRIIHESNDEGMRICFVEQLKNALKREGAYKCDGDYISDLQGHILEEGHRLSVVEWFQSVRS